MNNIILIGFMGSGKSTIGKMLSADLSLDYYDIDAFIEENTKMSIPEIFKRAGESWFRDQEAFALTCLTDAENRVIATGGGIVERPENLETMKKGGTVVYLKATVDKLWTRAGKDPNRPLSTDLASFRKRFDSRKALYEEAADIVIDTGSLSLERTLEAVKKALSDYGNKEE
ncbi:MAG: shikimate kinase [Lachnospiraceae bacterium]|nr:shikimate kinase [Lachnospiraceae bacterium]